jgi:predicted Co/Zn/Cd cation transporter (cation efflux family)
MLKWPIICAIVAALAVLLGLIGHSGMVATAGKYFAFLLLFSCLLLAVGRFLVRRKVI